MRIQRKFRLKPKARGFHLITDELLCELPELRNFKIGILFAVEAWNPRRLLVLPRGTTERDHPPKD